MLNKLTLRMAYTQIGHKILPYIILVSLLSSCTLFESDDFGDYSYKSYILNSSKDAIRIQIGKSSIFHQFDTIILPNELVFYEGGLKVDKNDNVLIDHLFSEYNPDLDIVYLYKCNDLILTWEGPAHDMGNLVHHFYNYQSWSVDLDKNEFNLIFTILNSDIGE